MMRFLLLLITLFAVSDLTAQNQGNIWYFGDHAGLDFNSGSPVPITNGQTYFVDGTHNEGTATICDSSGALLFYTNGEKIWNRNHVVMPNGDSLLGGFSSTQSSLIIPRPGSDRFFYVFTTDDFYGPNAFAGGFRYSVVDICMNNGFGDVMSGQKNILLLDTVSEKLTAVRHSNGTDYWIITHKYFSDAFYCYQLSASGIIDTVITHIGSVHPTGLQNTGAAIGQMKASPNGQKLVVVNGNSNNNIAEYFDFDPATGIVSNAVDLQWNLVYNFYGASFSPDNSKLYITSCLNGSALYQFDLTAGGGDPDSVRASRYSVSAVQYNFLGIQLGPDGKIYICHSPLAGNPNISVIHNPNVAGAGCNYADNSIYLNGQSASYTFPNFVDSYDYSNTIADCETIGVQENQYETVLNVFPNPVSGDATLQVNHELHNATVTLTNSLGQRVQETTGVEGSNIMLKRGDLPPGIYFLQIMDEGTILGTTELIFE